MGKLSLKLWQTIPLAIISIAMMIVLTILTVQDKKKTDKLITEKTAKIAELEKELDTCKVAMRFDNLFLMMADPHQIMKMDEAIKKLIEDKKDFHRKRKFSRKKDSFNNDKFKELHPAKR